MARAGSQRPLRTVRLSRLRRSSAVRWPLFILAFLALGIQNLVVQPHIHAQPTNAALALEIPDGENGSAGDFPIERVQTDCPLCQSTHQHEQYLRPSATAFALPPFVHYRTVDIVQRPRVYETISHSWQGRAPPQA